MRAYRTSANAHGPRPRVQYWAVARFCRCCACSSDAGAKHPQAVCVWQGHGSPRRQGAPLEPESKSGASPLSAGCFKQVQTPHGSVSIVPWSVLHPLLGRGTATEQTLRPSGYLPGQRDPCLSPPPAHDSLCDPAWGIAACDPGAGGSHVRRLGTQSPATCDCKLSSRLRGGSRASDKHSTAADRVHYILAWQHAVGVPSRVPLNMLSRPL